MHLDLKEADRLENPEEKEGDNEEEAEEESPKFSKKFDTKEKNFGLQKKKGKYTIQDCIEKFVEREQLVSERLTDF